MVKAGGAGSNPDGVANQGHCVSQPLSTLLKEIGEAVFNLNTLVVGLDAVEKGHEKPDGLDISWDPVDRRIAARKSRKFMLESILVRVSEAIGQYVSVISMLPRLSVVRSNWTSNTSGADRARDVFTYALGKSFLVPGSMLLMHWRNRIIHRRSNAALNAKEKFLLRRSEEEIVAKYKNLSVDRLLCHFEEGRPTLKDVSSLIAMSINAARKADRIIQAPRDKDDLDALLNYYKLVPLLQRVAAETVPEKLTAALRRVFQANAPLLLESYFLHYSGATDLLTIQPASKRAPPGTSK